MIGFPRMSNTLKFLTVFTILQQTYICGLNTDLTIHPFQSVYVAITQNQRSCYVRWNLLILFVQLPPNKLERSLVRNKLKSFIGRT